MKKIIARYINLHKNISKNACLNHGNLCSKIINCLARKHGIKINPS